MILQLWDVLFLIIVLFCLILGVRKGFLRTLTLFSSHFFSSVLALVFSPSLTVRFNRYLEGNLTTHFPSFLLLYLIPMVLLTQFFRVMYKRNIQKYGKLIGKKGRWGGVFTGLLLGAFFCFFFTWLLLLQPFIPTDRIYSLGGVVFSHFTRVLQLFMRFYV